MKNKIAILRKERGLTQQALAEQLKVSRQTVISLENGRYNPSIRLSYDIAQVFGCIIEEVFLFAEEDEA
ncbi:MAG: helix-turn-helix transcriptional regulator [Firmicutes bacterium]|nr:helix-turn-helix transcriptional regulator [Bacillota bacterium]